MNEPTTNRIYHVCEIERVDLLDQSVHTFRVRHIETATSSVYTLIARADGQDLVALPEGKISTRFFDDPYNDVAEAISAWLVDNA